METFFMVSALFGSGCGREVMMFVRQSETLKYLYLLFEDDSVLPLSSTCCFVHDHCPKATNVPHRIRLQHGGMHLLALHPQLRRSNRVLFTGASIPHHLPDPPCGLLSVGPRACIVAASFVHLFLCTRTRTITAIYCYLRCTSGSIPTESLSIGWHIHYLKVSWYQYNCKSYMEYS